MKNFIPLLIILLLNCLYTEAQSPLNLDMEKVDYSTMVPQGWTVKGNKSFFRFKIDSVIKQQGKYSLFIESKNAPVDSASVTYSIKALQAGQKFTFKGFVKTDNNSGGYFFIHMRGDKADKYMLINEDGVDLEDNGFKPTNDWQPFSFQTEYDEVETDSIYFGIVSGENGKIWLDNVSLEFDGKNISKAPIKKPGFYPARLDTVFRHASGVNVISLDEQTIKNLTNLGLLWGFLKYHHPAIAKGNYNWDAELFKILPEVLAAENKTAANKTLEEWVDKLGKPDKCTNCVLIKKGSSIKLMPDYGNLFKEGNLSHSLITKLQYILKNRTLDNKYYIRLWHDGYLVFKNEDVYEEMTFPDAGYRVLALYRFWNIIQYFYPYRNLIDGGWDKVLPEFIPKLANARDALAYHTACAELVTRIHDSHALAVSNVLADNMGSYFTPIKTMFVENQLVVTDYYLSDAGLKQKIKLGDVITSVNNVDVQQLIKELSRTTGASNYPTLMFRMARHRMLRGQSAALTLDILRDNKKIIVQLERVMRNKLDLSIDRDPPSSSNSFKLIKNGIGYLLPAKFNCSQIDSVKQLFKDAKGIIIDLRFRTTDCISAFINSWIKPTSSAHAKATIGNSSTPGLFTFLPRPVTSSNNSDYYKGKIVVLVNEFTQSALEGQVMRLQSAPNTTVVGSTTAGANGNVASVYFPGNIRTNITGLGIYYPDGSDMQRVGVKIDIPVKPTIKGVKEGRDELLEKAIEIIESSAKR